MKHDHKHTFHNPILPGFYPDPSICRAGDDYYLITSSFSFFPGVPLFHSRDLVHWEQIGHVLNRPSQLNLDRSDLSAGIFAPTIRYHNGNFYVITTNRKNGGNFIVTAKAPGGPWSEPFFIKNAPGIDPSLFFDDDGMVYYIGTKESEPAEYQGDSVIYCQEIHLDTMSLQGERHELWKGALKFTQWVEAPHIYKKNGFYYLMIAEGGTGYHHAITIARSKSLWGTYKGNPSNPILTHRHLGKGYPISNPGHGDLVETQTGQWWMVCLASRPYEGFYRNLGRETFLAPVTWEDDWPVISYGTGRLEASYQVPDLVTYPVTEAKVRDDFDGETLELVWNSIRTPREEFYSLNERKSFLSLKLRPQSLTSKLYGPAMSEEYDAEAAPFVCDSPSFIGRRQQHKSFTAGVKMEFAPTKEGEMAGLALIQNHNFQYRIEYMIRNGSTVVRLMRYMARMEMNSQEKTFFTENIETELTAVLFHSAIVYLKIIANGQSINFYYGHDYEDMKLLLSEVDGRHLSPDKAGGYIGTYIGMFAQNIGTQNGEIQSKKMAYFDWFDYEGKEVEL